MTQETNELVNSLRELADFYEANPELPAPHAVTLLIPKATKETFGRFAQGGGRWEKSTDDHWFNLCRVFGSIKLEVYADRESVCTRRVIGTREITEEVTDPDAPKLTVTRTVEEVEWDCPPVLLQAVKA